MCTRMRRGRAYGQGMAVLSCYNGKGRAGRWHDHATVARGDHAISLVRHGWTLQRSEFVAVFWFLCLEYVWGMEAWPRGQPQL